MRQSTLLEFEIPVLTVYIPIRKYPYKSRQGLAELQLRKRLEKQGWQVWRGGFVHAIAADVYPAVKRRYVQLAELITELYGDKALDLLCYLCTVHHGMPDLVCYNPALKQFKFVECKLGHEGLSDRQVVTIQRLQEAGFQVEVHKLVEECTKTRKAEVNLATKEKKILEKEMKLTRFIYDKRPRVERIQTAINA
ncbi:MAG: VRR-NUC domain-containing protein [Candidatus Woesearchaeota archaeon]|nr:VRR-NUC domain-containing protein [Candidatus Woesearchaeota archaeon]